MISDFEVARTRIRVYNQLIAFMMVHNHLGDCNMENISHGVGICNSQESHQSEHITLRQVTCNKIHRRVLVCKPQEEIGRAKGNKLACCTHSRLFFKFIYFAHPPFWVFSFRGKNETSKISAKLDDIRLYRFLSIKFEKHICPRASPHYVREYSFSRKQVWVTNFELKIYATCRRVKKNKPTIRVTGSYSARRSNYPYYAWTIMTDHWPLFTKNSMLHNSGGKEAVS